MQAMTKMTDLTKFRQTDLGQIGDFMQIITTEIFLTCWRIWRFWGDFYANYVTRDIPDM